MLAEVLLLNVVGMIHFCLGEALCNPKVIGKPLKIFLEIQLNFFLENLEICQPRKVETLYLAFKNQHLEQYST